jgi:hypothetical protein
LYTPSLYHLCNWELLQGNACKEICPDQQHVLIDGSEIEEIMWIKFLTGWRWFSVGRFDYNGA